jgi:hypothetical protein
MGDRRVDRVAAQQALRDPAIGQQQQPDVLQRRPLTRPAMLGRDAVAPRGW